MRESVRTEGRDAKPGQRAQSQGVRRHDRVVWICCAASHPPSSPGFRARVFAWRSSRRQLVSKRRRLMLYLHTKKPEVAENLAAELGIRFKFQNQIPSRAEKYREFTIRANQRRK